MNISEPFIRRPIATTLLMIGVLLAGLVGYQQLPVSALPQVDYPTIVVTTSLPGASAETMVSSITTPLERQFGQIPALSQMTSVSSLNSSLMNMSRVVGPAIGGVIITVFGLGVCFFVNAASYVAVIVRGRLADE